MKQPSFLDALAAQSHWHRDADAVLVSLPELSNTRFKLESWPIGQQGATWVLPITGISRLAGAVLETMEKGRADGADAFLRARPEVVASDVLVAQMGTLLPGLPTSALPRVLLGVIALSSSLLSKERKRAVELDPAIARRSLALSESIWGLEEGDRAEELGRISDALSARVSAAFQIHKQPADGLCRRLIANRLIWVIGHDDLDGDLGLASAILGLPIDRKVVHTIQEVTRVAVSAARGRMGGRKERPADAHMERLFSNVKGEPLMDHYAGESLVRLLPHLIDARGLKGRVDDHKQAARFLEPAAVRTVAGAWHDLTRGLRPWDIISTLTSQVQLVARTATGWRLERNPLDDHERWSLAIPREEPRRVHTVVAVRFGELLESGGADVRHVVRERWADMLGKDRVGTWVGDHGIAAFNRPADAIRFALDVNASFLTADGFLGQGEDRVAVAPGTRTPVGIAEGTIVGGVDGKVVQFDGPAVSSAIHLSGRGPLTQANHDPMRIRKVSVGEYGLESGGVALSRAVATSVWNGWGAPVHRYGDGSHVAGTAKDFECYPIDGWAAYEDGALVFVSMGKNRGGSVLEAMAMGAHGFKDLTVRDEQLQSGGGDVSSVLSDGDPSEEPTVEVDPFGFDAKESQGTEYAEKEDAWGGISFGDDEGSGR